MLKKVTFPSDRKEPTTEEKIIAIDSLRGKYKLTVLLTLSGLPKSTYNYHKNKSSKKEKDQIWLERIKAVIKANYLDYGYERITLRLQELGYIINHKKVYRIMQENNLIKKKKLKYKSYRGPKNINIDNVLNRDFSTNSPYQKLGTDITYFVIPKGKLYLSPIIDFHTREILAYDLSRKPNFNQIKRMMNSLVLNHGDMIKESYMQSDQGWQYQMKWYQLELEKQGILQSMSRKGNCLDNSPTENFFGRMKVEMFNNRSFKSLEHLEEEIHKYLKYYNEERIVTKLKTSPSTYRARFYNQTNT